MSSKKIHPLTVVMKGKISYIDQNNFLQQALNMFFFSAVKLDILTWGVWIAVLVTSVLVSRERGRLPLGRDTYMWTAVNGTILKIRSISNQRTHMKSPGVNRPTVSIKRSQSSHLPTSKLLTWHKRTQPVSSNPMGSTFFSPFSVIYVSMSQTSTASGATGLTERTRESILKPTAHWQLT